MNILENLINAFAQMQQTMQRKINPTPAQFRRGYRKVHFFASAPDPNSKHVGSFGGKITPIRRRFHGVSRTARK